MVRIVLVFLFALFTVWSGYVFAAPDNQQIPSAIVSDETPTLVSSPDYSIAGHTLRLLTSKDACILEHHQGKSEITRLTLNIHPPCYLLTWNQKPPSKNLSSDVSDGVPIGGIGEPMAWQYARARNVLVLAVLGDALSQELISGNQYRLIKKQNFHCGSSIQGILIRDQKIELSTERANVGIFCAEIGIEEQDYWLLAHPTKTKLVR